MSDARATAQGLLPDQYRVGGSIVLSLDLQLLRASAVRVEVYAPTSSTPAIAETDAATPSVSAPVTAPSGIGSRSLQVDDPAIADLESGRSYLLDGEGVSARVVTLVDVDESGTPPTVKLATQLEAVIPAGAELRDTIATYNATSAALPRARGYRARWLITPESGGADVEIWTAFDVVYQPFQVILTRADVEGRWSQVGQSLDDDWSKSINAAVQEIANEIDGAGMEPDKVRNTAPLRPAAAWFICRTIALSKSIGDQRWLKIAETFERYYSKALKQGLAAVRQAYDHADENKREDANERRAAAWWDANWGSDGRYKGDGS